jgi:AcrR family transcriptional regulator
VAANRSEDILDAAQKIFSEVGYHAARIEDIAQTAEVGKGTVYLYFPGKKELFCALMRRTMENHLDAVERALESAGSLEEKLTRVAREHLSLFESKKELASLNVHELINTDETFKEKMLAHRARYVNLIAAGLAQNASGARTADACREAAIAFTGLLHVFQFELIHDIEDLDAQGLPERLTALFLHGFDA